MLMMITQITSPLQNSIMLCDLKLETFFIMHKNIHSFANFFDKFHSFASELNRAADIIVLQRHGSLPTLLMMFRATQAFIHIVLTKQEAVSLCSL